MGPGEGAVGVAPDEADEVDRSPRPALQDGAVRQRPSAFALAQDGLRTRVTACLCDRSAMLLGQADLFAGLQGLARELEKDGVRLTMKHSTLGIANVQELWGF